MLATCLWASPTRSKEKTCSGLLQTTSVAPTILALWCLSSWIARLLLFSVSRSLMDSL